MYTSFNAQLNYVQPHGYLQQRTDALRHLDHAVALVKATDEILSSVLADDRGRKGDGGLFPRNLGPVPDAMVFFVKLNLGDLEDDVARVKLLGLCILLVAKAGGPPGLATRAGYDTGWLHDGWWLHDNNRRHRARRRGGN